ncbi:antA/AntB antirepressor family protein [Bacillus cereus]
MYKFLELVDGQFARWAKTNITENGFAIEHEDYMRVDMDVETPTGGMIKREDYKLTATFAKKYV